jgi:hypothetical protein
VQWLEEEVRREERSRGDLRERLRAADEANRELVAFVRGLQSQSDTELAQMRTFLQERVN